MNSSPLSAAGYDPRLRESIGIMTAEADAACDHTLHSVWLYGSAVMNDFRPGWSDIDLITLTSAPLTSAQAQHLLTLRQDLSREHPENPYLRCFEGIIACLEEYRTWDFTRLVYWGTSGQRITDRHHRDPFAEFELAEYGRCVFGDPDRRLFTRPQRSEMIAAVRSHYETIRTWAVTTDESLYSCGWLLDIARCIYTLRHWDVTGKTQAGLWALDNHLFPDEADLKKTLLIRQEPLKYKDLPEIRKWLRELGPTVQRYAGLLENELAALPAEP